MPIIRKLIAHHENEDNLWLKVDHASYFIENDSNDWQFLFGPNSLLSNSNQILKIGAEFNANTLDSIRLIAYLYDPNNGSIDNAATCTFNIFKVNTPNWSDDLITTLSGTQLSNNYFFLNVPTSSLPTVDFFGGDTVLIEVIVTRLGTTYRDRMYLNHFGIFDNVTRLRQEVQFLDISKQDI